MENLITALQTAWTLAGEIQRKHAEQLEALNASWQAKLDQDRAELLEDYESRITDLRHAHAIDTDALHEDLKMLRESTAEAKNLLDEVEAERVGTLDTSTLPKRLFFEALSEKWEGLTNSQIEFITEYLNGES